MSVFKDMAAWYRFDDAGDVGKMLEKTVLATITMLLCVA